MRRGVFAAGAFALAGCRVRRESGVSGSERSTVRKIERLSSDSSGIVAVVRLESPRVIIRGDSGPAYIEAEQAEAVVLARHKEQHACTALDSSHAAESARTAVSAARVSGPFPGVWLLAAAAVILLLSWRGIRSRR